MKTTLLVVTALLLLGCNDSQTQTPKDTPTPKEAKAQEMEKKPTGIKSTIAPVRTVSAKGLYMKCAGCHGADASKSALGKSKLIKGWNVEKLREALEGYQDGSYGGDMKNLMQSQVKDLNAVDIDILSRYISKL